MSKLFCSKYRWNKLIFRVSRVKVLGIHLHVKYCQTYKMSSLIALVVNNNKVKYQFQDKITCFGKSRENSKKTCYFSRFVTKLGKLTTQGTVLLRWNNIYVITCSNFSNMVFDLSKIYVNKVPLAKKIKIKKLNFLYIL